MKKDLLSVFAIFTLLAFGGCNKDNTSSTLNTSSSIVNSSIEQSSDESGPIEHLINVIENDKCTIEVSKAKAFKNEEINVVVKDIESGYYLNKITVNNLFIDNGCFIMPDFDVTIEAHLSNESNYVSGQTHRVDIQPSEYALIEVDELRYSEGEEVQINYTCRGNYILDKFYVNDIAIDGTTFIMPNIDVEIKGTFIKAISDTPWQVSCESGGLTASTYWYFEYGNEGLNINVKVDDRMICGAQFAANIAYQDNIELILTPKSDSLGRLIDKTHRILVSCNGQYTVQKAVTSVAYGPNLNYEEDVFNLSSDLKSLEEKEGYNGYEINMFIAYSAFAMTKDEALNNLSACLSMRNTTTYNATNWNFYAGETGNWDDVCTHPIILENNKLEERA